ncbi:MAG: dienelactone hydrolase family protein [Bacteroidota bacterium]
MAGLTELVSIPGYLSRPQGNGLWPGVIVIHEWWGLGDQIRSVADRLAAAQYLAFAPDLYRGELAPLGDSDKATVLVQKYGPGAPDELAQVFDALKSHPNCSGKVGIVGFCFGGRMALMLGLARPVDAVVTFYGGGMQQIFSRMGSFQAPAVLGFFGDQDISIPAGTIAEFERLLKGIDVEHEVITYPNSGHAFFRDTDPASYRPEAASDAWERLLRFFGQHLS